MTIQKLKELLNQYPDEAVIAICYNRDSGDVRDITSINIEYVSDDDYALPEIILK